MDFLLQRVKSRGLIFSLCLLGPVGCGYEGDASDPVTCCLGSEFSPEVESMERLGLWAHWFLSWLLDYGVEEGIKAIAYMCGRVSTSPQVLMNSSETTSLGTG